MSLMAWPRIDEFLSQVRADIATLSVAAAPLPLPRASTTLVDGWSPDFAGGGRICAVTLTVLAADPDKPQLTLMRAGSRPHRRSAENFTGKARIDRQVRPDDPSRPIGSMVCRARARPASPLGQTLIVISGCGWIQAEGGPKMIQPGDVIWTPPNVRHWHGARMSPWRITPLSNR
jgi:quercetin dioxygenase-like cupin family protein